MGQAIGLRDDFTAADLRALARASNDGDWTRRLLAVSIIYDGGSRSQAAALGGVGLQIVRDWVVRFNAKGPEGLKTGKAKGQPFLLNDLHRHALAKAIDEGPLPYRDGVVRWRLCDLTQWLWEEFRISISPQTLSRELRSLGYRRLSARPKHHAQDPDAIEEYKKTSPPLSLPSPVDLQKAK